MTTAARMSKVVLRTCPRCHGDLFIEPEEDSYACLQCGRVVTAKALLAQVRVDPLLETAMSTNRGGVKLPYQEVDNDAA